jgi:1,4-alpha-glucan branching enzyme
MMTHPGKKALFMGQDFAEFDEWNEGRRLQWDLLQYPEHAGVAELMKDLNQMYRTYPALYELDDSPAGFEWINNISANDCYLTFLRKTEEPEEVLLVVANFSGVEKEITTGVPYEGKYKEILNTDAVKYGGSGVVNSRVKAATDTEWDDRRQSITVRLAAQSMSILQFIPYTEEELTKVIEERIRKNTPVMKKKTSGVKTSGVKTSRVRKSKKETGK